jgi:double zinc ribbon protein
MSEDIQNYSNCDECKHRRMKIIVNPFSSLGKDFSPSPEIIKKIAKWEQELNELQKVETQRVEENGTFDQEPSFFPWCAKWTDKNNRIAIDPVAGTETRIYELCVKANFYGNCSLFESVILESACQNCGTEIQQTDKFCSACGQQNITSPSFCQSCKQELEHGDRFCFSCGADVGTGFEKTKQHVECIDCANYREVIPISSLLPINESKAVNEELLKIVKDESQLQESELEFKVEQIKISRVLWGSRPRMSVFCAAKAEQKIYEICEAKNRLNNCADFRPKTAPTAICASCIHREIRSYPYAAAANIPKPEVSNKILDEIDAKWALEISTIYHAKGECRHVPEYHDYCLHSSSDGKYMALPYPNIHSDCLDYEPKAAFAKPFLDFIAGSKKKRRI